MIFSDYSFIIANPFVPIYSPFPTSILAPESINNEMHGLRTPGIESLTQLCLLKQLRTCIPIHDKKQKKMPAQEAMQ